MSDQHWRHPVRGIEPRKPPRSTVVSLASTCEVTPRQTQPMWVGTPSLRNSLMQNQASFATVIEFCRALHGIPGPLTQDADPKSASTSADRGETPATTLRLSSARFSASDHARSAHNNITLLISANVYRLFARPLVLWARARFQLMHTMPSFAHFQEWQSRALAQERQ